MKKIFLLIILLILLPSVLSTEISLFNGQSHNYKERIIKLVTVGSSGSAFLNVNNIDKVISKNNPLEIMNIKISLLESDYVSQAVRLGIEDNAECLVDEDCDDDKPCTKDTCDIYNSCHHKRTTGCPLENECKLPSSLGEINGVLSYCEETEWLSRKQHRESCKNNYECLSNVCAKGKCRLALGGNKMAPAWLIIIFAILLGIKGLLFLTTPKYSRIIGRNLMKLISNKNYRIIGAIMLVVSVLLIIWAVI